MDQDPRTAGEAVGARVDPAQEEDQQRTPADIRADIEQTREEVGDTVEALAAKTDVKAQAQSKIEEVKANVRAKAKGSTPEGAQKGGRQVVAVARANPAPVALTSAALFGFLVGKLTSRRS